MQEIFIFPAMFFFLSKILYAFLSPFKWLLLLVLYWLLTKHKERKRRAGILIVILFLIFSNPYLIYRITLAWQYPKKEMMDQEQYNTGILLAGFVSFETQKKQGYYGGAADRFIQAVRLYKLGHIKKILITGGSGSIRFQQYKEADFVVQQLKDFGVPAEDILSENKSRNTFENALNSKKILDSLKIRPPYLLITSALHMRRSIQVFEKAGIAVTPYPCNFHAIQNPKNFMESFIPSFRSFDGWELFLKESIGLLVYRVTGKA
jgi:uncharacterized SAM-binding protein YcdF (DUF218 family)